MGECDLCGLPTSTPLTGDAPGDERYCCSGCRQVAERIGNTERPQPAARAESDTVSEAPADAAVAYFTVDGMHCPTCEQFLGMRADDLEGVYAVEAQYGMNAARVAYDPDRLPVDTVADRLSGMGYHFTQREAGSGPAARRRQADDRVSRLLVGGACAMLVMPWYFFYLYPQYVGLGGGILELGRTTTVGVYFPLFVIALLTTLVLAYTGYPILRGAWISLRTGQPNMDLLVGIAAVAAFGYSVIALALGRTHLYFDVTIMVVLVVTAGRHYEAGLRRTATEQLAGITAARVNEATRLSDTGREVVPISDLEPGDRVQVIPGEHIPLDGTITAGTADLDESLLTGEGVPVTKGPGAQVIGGSKVLDHPVTVTIGPEAISTVDRIAAAMWEIQSRTPGIQRIVDKLATIFVPAVLLLGVAVTAWHVVRGQWITSAVLTGLTVLLVSCPCAMGLATPLAIAGGLRDALGRGVVITNEAVFDADARVERLVLDKTGTLTTGSMTVTDVVGHPETLVRAAGLEAAVDHPIATAICDAAPERVGATDGGEPRGEPIVGPATAAAVTQVPGDGLVGEVDGRRVAVGTPDLVRERIGPIPAEFDEAAARFNDAGARPVVVGWDGAARGVIAVSDTERDDWPQLIQRINPAEVIVLTGDDSGAVDRFRHHPAVDAVFSGLPPDAKAAAVTRFTEDGMTVMVGDGTNDAPALAAASIGIAVGQPTAEAVDAADAVLVTDDLTGAADVLGIARGTRTRIRENVGWALLYNAVAVPLAAVGLINPLFAALAMAGSSIIVVTNSRRAV